MFQKHASKRYRKLRQKDFGAIIPDMGARISSLEQQVTTAQGISSQMPGDRRVQSGEKSKIALKKVYNSYFSQNYQQEWLNYGNTSQRNEYGLNLARVEAMMISLGMEIPEYSLSSQYRENQPRRARDLPKVY